MPSGLLALLALEILVSLETATGHQSDWSEPYGVTRFGDLGLYVSARCVDWVLFCFVAIAVSFTIPRSRRMLWGSQALFTLGRWLFCGAVMEVVTTLASAQIADPYPWQGHGIYFASLSSYVGHRLAVWMPIAALMIAAPRTVPLPLGHEPP
jgi:hypothetical protein